MVSILRHPVLMKRWKVIVAMVVVLGATLAGVFVSKSKEASKIKHDVKPIIYHDNIMESLVAMNKLPVSPPSPTTLTDERNSNNSSTIGPSASPSDSDIPSPKSVSILSKALGDISTLINGSTSMASPPPRSGAVSPSVPAESVWARPWRAIGGGGGGALICYPKNGTEVVNMMDGKNPCTIVVLRRGSLEPYQIRQTMNITTTKVMVGNPIDPPMLNATNRIPRLFNVTSGGRLDLRSVTVIRGGGIRLDEGRLRVNIGGAVYVNLGGSFTGTGVIFRELNQTVSQFLEEVENMLTQRNRNFGGMIFVAGGNLYLQGCFFIRFRPFGSPIINTMQIGRDVLILAGNTVWSGCYNLNVNLFTNNVVMGNTICLFGGTTTWVGGTSSNIAGAQAQWGTIQMFIGGGVLVDVGFIYLTSNGALMRGGFGIFSVGGGVHIQTGYLQARSWGCASVNNAGQTFAVGGGIHQMVGGAIASTSIVNIFNGAGGTAFVGSGQLRFIGVAQATSSVAQSQYGLGFFFYNGAGSSNLIYVTQASGQVARMQAGLASDMFLGAGWLTQINNTRWTAQVANAFFGEGNQVWIGAGGAVFIRCWTVSYRVTSYSTTNNLYTVAGTGVSRTQGQKNILVTKRGRRPITKHRRRRSLPIDESKAASLMSEIAALSDSPAYYAEDGKSKLIVVQGRMEEFTKNVIDDPSAFKDKKYKYYFGGLTKILADREDLVSSSSSSSSTLQKAPSKKGLISVNNTHCFLCNVQPLPTSDHLSGPGTCEISEEEEDCMAPAATTSNSLQRWSSLLTDNNNNNTTFRRRALQYTDIPGQDMDVAKAHPKDLPDTWLLWHELVVYWSAAPAEKNATLLDHAGYLKDVIRIYFNNASEQQQEVVTTDDYQLSVASTGVEDYLKPWVQDDLEAAMEPEWNPDCHGDWRRYNIYMTTNNATVQALLTEEWDAILRNSSDFQTTILDSLLSLEADGGTTTEHREPCAMSVTRVGGARYPSLSNMKAFKPMTNELRLVGPSLTVASDASLTPITEVVEGETYKIYVQNFFQGAKVNVDLVKGVERRGTTIASIESFNDEGGDDGIEHVLWDVPVGAFSDLESRYYLMAYVASFPALFANSQAFKVLQSQDD